MYSKVHVTNGSIHIHLHGGHGGTPQITLTGATFPAAPSGATVEDLTFNTPDGLNACAFLSRVEAVEIHRINRHYQGLDPVFSGCMLLFWYEDNKVIIKTPGDMSPAELRQFNPFVYSGIDISVTDAATKTAYLTQIPKIVDPTWTYRQVSTEAILCYITKQFTMEQLAQQTTRESSTRDELEELRKQKRSLEETRDALTRQIGNLRDEGTRLKEQQTKVGEHRDRLMQSIRKSKGLYTFLKLLPHWMRPSAFDGFIEMYESFWGVAK